MLLLHLPPQRCWHRGDSLGASVNLPKMFMPMRKQHKPDAHVDQHPVRRLHVLAHGRSRFIKARKSFQRPREYSAARRTSWRSVAGRAAAPPRCKRGLGATGCERNADPIVIPVVIAPYSEAAVSVEMTSAPWSRSTVSQASRSESKGLPNSFGATKASAGLDQAEAGSSGTVTEKAT